MCTLYERIIELCKTKGVSGSRMCLDLGLSKSTLSDIKSGRKKGISTATAQKIASYLGVSTDYLLSGLHKSTVAVYANGICAYTGSTMQEIEAKLAEREANSFRIVHRVPGVVITVDTGSTPSNEQIDAVIAIYNPAYAQIEKAPTVSGERKPDVLDEVDVAFYGEYKQLSEDDKDTIRDMVRVMRERRAKKQE